MKLSSLLVKDIIHWNARCALKPQDIEVDEIQDNPPPLPPRHFRSLLSLRETFKTAGG